MKTILITGGTGYVGSNLTIFFLKNKYKVIVLYNDGHGQLSDDDNENLIFINKNNLEYIKDYNIDVIYHLASVQPSASISYQEFYETNVRFTLDIIQVAKENNVQQFIYVSTTSIFSGLGDTQALSEISMPNPSNNYGLTKYIAEKVIELELKSENLKVAIVRFPSIFGQNNDGIVKTIYESAIKSEDIEIYSNGERYRNLIYLDSAVEFLYLLYIRKDNLENFEVFMAGSNNSLRLLDIAKLIVKMTDSDSLIIPVNKYPPVDFDIKLKITKSITKLNFNALSIEDGLKKYINERQNENI